jgi:hypothetical protein
VPALETVMLPTIPESSSWVCSGAVILTSLLC